MAVSVDFTGAKAVAPFMEARNLSLPALLDPGGAILAKPYGLVGINCKTSAAMPSREDHLFYCNAGMVKNSVQKSIHLWEANWPESVAVGSEAFVRATRRR